MKGFIFLTILALLTLKTFTIQHMKLNKSVHQNFKSILKATKDKAFKKQDEGGADEGQDSSQTDMATVVPSAQGVGGEVILPCQECTQLISKFLTKCLDQEANGAVVSTFNAFCDEMEGPAEYCKSLNAKMASRTKESGLETTDNTKGPDVCMKFKNECDKLGGPPNCFSGFCDDYAECIDCPSGLVDMGQGEFESQVCSGSGVCKLGWKGTSTNGGNGYCECTNGRRGLACNVA